MENCKENFATRQWMRRTQVQKWHANQKEVTLRFNRIGDSPYLDLMEIQIYLVKLLLASMMAVVDDFYWNRYNKWNHYCYVLSFSSMNEIDFHHKAL